MLPPVLCAVGWVLKLYGWLWYRQQGVVLAIASRPDHQLLLQLNGRKLIMSPDDPAQIVASTH